MVYVVEVVLPVEVGMESTRVIAYTLENNEVVRHAELDLIDERRMKVFYQAERYWLQVARTYNKKVIAHSFQTGPNQM